MEMAGLGGAFGAFGRSGGAEILEKVVNLQWIKRNET